jgi:hypothetical protein
MVGNLLWAAFVVCVLIGIGYFIYSEIKYSNMRGENIVLQSTYMNTDVAKLTPADRTRIIMSNLQISEYRDLNHGTWDDFVKDSNLEGTILFDLNGSTIQEVK